MDGLFKLWSRKEIIVILRVTGELILGAGVITAALNKSFGGWTPVYFFLLALAFFVLIICSGLFRIILHLENKGIL